MVKAYSANIQCEVDQIAAKKGITILRLPPYHPEVHTVQLISNTMIVRGKNDTKLLKLLQILHGKVFFKRMPFFCTHQ